MWFRRLLTIAILAVLTVGAAEAQIYRSEVQLPWNGYLATRIPNAFTEIIGQPGTTLIAGSNTGSSTQVYNLALPFNFTFIGSLYTTGFQLKVGANGYISFNSPLTSGVPDLSQNGGYYLIMPYWSDIAPGNAPEGGVYWRLDGAPGSRVLTVEWRCDGANPPRNTPGQFQAKLYEGSNKIEFFYSANALARGNAIPTNGAAVGIKYVGFPTYPFPPSGNDAEKFILCSNPDVMPDTVAVTRTRHGLISQAWLGIPNWTTAIIPETYANWPLDAQLSTSEPSRYFHYTFPTQGGNSVGFRFTSVANDVAGDSAIYTAATPGNVYSRNDFFQFSGRFRNLGANTRQNVPVFANIYREGNPVPIQSFSGNAFPAVTAQNGTSTVSFGLVGSGVTGLAGTYTIKMFSNLVGDQDRTNDTLYSVFYVAFDNDVRATQILQPTTFTIQLPAVYPVSNPMVPEIRFQNIGGNPQTNVPVGFEIYDATCQRIYTGTGVVRGTWNPLEFRDVTFDGSPWTPTSPGQYFIKAFTNLTGDENRFNDTLFGYPSCGKEFSVRYEIEVQALAAGFTPGIQPDGNAVYADNRPINLRMGYRNNGIIDATNVPGRIEIRKGDCNTGQLVYQRNITIPTVPGEASGNGTTVTYPMGFFIPTLGPGTYCITSIISDAQDPVHANDTARWTFIVRPRLSGTIYVGVGERFRTIQEANDSLYFYGMSGNVDFKLVDDQFTVRPGNNDPLLPALDGRGDVMGSGPNAVVTWSPVAGKTNVDIILKSPSGIGIIYGQRDTSNPTGYQVWDGGPNRIIRFLMDTAGPVPPTKSIPFFFTQGASNFTVKNCRIEPRVLSLGLKTAMTLPIVKYSRTFNTFTYDQDVSSAVAISAGILSRNSAPADINGNNPGPRRRDTLRNQNNTFSNNWIKNFAYGIVSIGAGPLYRVGDDAYTEYSNQNNTITNNIIEDVARAGIALVYEKNSTIAANTIRRVINPQPTVRHAAGIWVSSGGLAGVDTVKNRGYSDNLKIDRNSISVVNAAQGNGAGIWVETTENVFTSTSSRVYRYPVNGAVNHAVTNNMMWNYAGQTGGAGTGQTAGIGLTMGGDTRIDFVTTGNRVENNTMYNQIAGTITEFGIGLIRAQGSFRNNIIALVTPTNNPIGVGVAGPNIGKATVNLDYNLYWIPNGSVGAMSKLSTNGFNIPSPPIGKTLNQWRALSGLDSNSLEGNVTTEFVSTVPGSENLHMQNNLTGALANNRGVNIAAVTQDIDADPRGSGGALSRYDIGADEFYGNIRNNDLLSEDIIAPFGYRAPTGQYSDAEYMMIDQAVPIWGRFRNMGGLPQLSNTVTATAEYWNGAAWVNAGFQNQQTTSFNVAESKTIGFGTFAPRTLLQTGINDAFYGMSPNVTPIYRFRITSGIDDYAGNNVYEKLVRFYVRRSDRYALVSVEGRQAAMPVTALGKSNKLNADTLLAALDSIKWQRSDGVNLEDYDLFDRDKWPKEDLNFQPWKIVIWAQGAEAQGMEPEERAALKVMLDSRNMYNRSNLIIAGQDIARIHDVALTALNGQVADQDFVRNYLRGEYRGNTNPNPYSTGTQNPNDANNRTIRGVAINPGKFELIWPTAVVGDNPPMPALVRPTSGEGIARSTHYYNQQTLGAYTDSSSGVATAAEKRNVVFYAQDWRHYGRFLFEADRSGAQRLLLSGLDFVKHYEGVVPVEVKSFDAYQSGRTTVKVDWSTGSEIDVASLEIERAVVEHTSQGDRVGEFSVIERKAPAGTATKGASYSVLDPNVEIGSEYVYRLTSVGVDGSRKHESEDRVKITGAVTGAGMTMTVQPNPARSVVFIDVKLPEASKATVELYDGAGRLVKVLAKDEVVSASRIELNVEELPSGAYTVRMVTAGGKELTQKLNVTK